MIRNERPELIHAAEEGVRWAIAWRREQGIGERPLVDLAGQLLTAGVDVALRPKMRKWPLCMDVTDGGVRATIGSHMSGGGVRFWMAHALGHRLFGDELPRRCPPSTWDEEEARAVAFADEVLLPTAAVSAIGDNVLIGRIFGVTAGLVQRRRTQVGRDDGADRRVLVLVDHREEASGVPDLLAAHADVDVRLMALPVGDYLVADEVLVERKTAADFVASARDGRLVRQLARLAASGRRGVLLLEGCEPEVVRARLGVPQHRGLLAWALANKGVSVVRSGAPGETALWIAAIARQVAAGGGGGRWRVGRQGRAGRGDGSGRVGRGGAAGVLMAVEGIGPKRAAALLDWFGSVEGVLAAGDEELCSVVGVDRGVVGRLRGVVG